MNNKIKPLAVIDGETLMDARPEPIRFCIDTVLPQGLCLLGGAPKIGKSWLVLDICVRVAKGAPVWGFQTASGTVLYLCLEDSYNRISGRLSAITDEVSDNVFFAVSAETVENGLCEQIREFCRTHSNTVLVAIDTFQLIRSAVADPSYANDYKEMRVLKALADELKICLLLVHHLRKQGDSDPMNKISGTTGISGATDATYILDKSRRSADSATLYCLGRDIEYREFQLRFDQQNCVWTMQRDSLEIPEILLPKEMQTLVSYVKDIKMFDGGNAEFTENFNAYANTELSAKALKQMMNRSRYQLENAGVYFENRRTNGQRFVRIYFSSASDEYDGGDENITVAQSCVPVVTCAPADFRGDPKKHRFGGGEQSARLSAGEPCYHANALFSAGEPAPLSKSGDESCEKGDAVI